jgi:benzylsuccinate CoA-transferase BbsF subunit
MGNRSTYAAPHGVYRCKGNDRWCVITVFTDNEWRKLCEVIGSPYLTQDPEFSTILGRVKHYDKIDRLIEQWTITHTPKEVMLLMQNAGIAAVAVQDFEEQSKDPQLEHRHFYWKMNLPDIGDFTYSGMPAKLSKTHYEMKRAPFLGEHNQYICTELLGMSDEEFSHLKEDGVFE